MSAPSHSRLYCRIAVRIIPFLFICYVLNFIDRVNIGFAKLQFLHDLGLGEGAFGMATGIFFISYAAFELPSNLMLARIGARKTLMRIMLLWGLCTVGQTFMTGATSLYVLRFLLGMAEAGFFPGLILYLSYWFPDTVRARVNSVLLLAVPIAGIVGGPLSGSIMSQLHDFMGLRGWQWLFLIEGVPAIVLGLLAPFMLSDRPDTAKWLSGAERQMLQQDLTHTHAKAVIGHEHISLMEILRSRRILGLATVYFCIYVGLVAVAFWGPTILKFSGVVSVASIGWLSGLISVLTMLGNLAIAYSSDRRMERRWHIAGCMVATAVSLFLLRFSLGNVPVTVALVAIAQLSIFTVPIIYWTIPAAQLVGRSAAAGIAIISALGSIGGAFSSWIVGGMMARTGSPYAGLAIVGGLLLFGAILLMWMVPGKSSEFTKPLQQVA
ncbi:major facilitator transporter [Pandoraea thiooxydans]|uniref:MFS transporter n=1 Tax=Pandoraea thiooxydans TaxID=445709 RepID=A0A0G3EW52_9BURK|nr:MFS transporter [Pandoraea thiooxydans]AKJ70249.1 MFS transporter [Pandoraea thiooxydans]APR93724.1 major facilitator transporter [Pandoraea thiooxydans]